MELALNQDAVGRKLFPGRTYDGNPNPNPINVFGMIRIGGTSGVFPGTNGYDNLTNFIYSSDGNYEFEKEFLDFIKTNCVNLMNTAFMFDSGKITLDSLGGISSSLYTTDERHGEFKSSYLCFLLIINPNSIPILVSTGVLVFTNDDFGHLWSFSTNPLYSGRGYGTFFINRIKQDLKRIGVRQLRLVVSNSNYPFMSFEERLLFYVKKGFSVGSQNPSKPNIKIYPPDRTEYRIKGIGPNNATECLLIEVDSDGNELRKLQKYTDLKNSLISVIDPSKQLIGISVIDSTPKITPLKGIPMRSYSGPPDKLYSCLFHGEIINKSFKNGTIKTFKVPENVELIVLNQIGSYLYDYQWILFLQMYNDFEMSTIPIEILQYIFPKCRTTNITYTDETTRPEILVPSLVKNTEHNIKVTKQFSSSLLIKRVNGHAFTARVYESGDICPEMSLSMTIHTKAGADLRNYEKTFRGGGLRVSPDNNTLYIPPENFIDPSAMISDDRVFPDNSTVLSFTDTSVSGTDIKLGQCIKTKHTLSEIINKAIKHSKSRRVPSAAAAAAAAAADDDDDDDDDEKRIRIVVGCCAGLYSYYSKELLEYFRNVMVIPGFNSIKEVKYTSKDELSTIMNNLGRAIQLFDGTVTSGELLRIFESSSTSETKKQIILKRLFNLLNYYKCGVVDDESADTGLLNALYAPAAAAASSSSSSSAAGLPRSRRTRRKKKRTIVKRSKRKTFKSKKRKTN